MSVNVHSQFVAVTNGVVEELFLGENDWAGSPNSGGGRPDLEEVSDGVGSFLR